MGLGMPSQLQRVWQGKLQAVKQSAAQMDTSLRSLDPSERENAFELLMTHNPQKNVLRQARRSPMPRRSGAKDEILLTYIYKEHY